MQIFKEYCKASKRCVIRTNAHAHSFGYFKMLVVEAKKDVPDVNEDEIEIVLFGGRHYKHTFGIEFECVAKPDGYEEIDKLEYTM